MTHDHDVDDPRLTAYALGELDDNAERAEIEALLTTNDDARRIVADISATARLLSEQLRAESGPSLAPAHKAAIEECLAARPRAPRWWPPLRMALAASLLLTLVGLGTFWSPWHARDLRPSSDLAWYQSRQPAMSPTSAPRPATATPSAVKSLAVETPQLATSEALVPGIKAKKPALVELQQKQVSRDSRYPSQPGEPSNGQAPSRRDGDVALREQAAAGEERLGRLMDKAQDRAGKSDVTASDSRFGTMASVAENKPAAAKPAQKAAEAEHLLGNSAMMFNSLARRSSGTAAKRGVDVRQKAIDAEKAGKDLAQYRLAMPSSGGMAGGPALAGRANGPVPPAASLSAGAAVTGPAPPAPASPSAGPVTTAPAPDSLALAKPAEAAPVALGQTLASLDASSIVPNPVPIGESRDEAKPANAPLPPPADPGRERFEPIADNPFVRSLQAPQSTFGIDVDTASYALVRRMLLGENRLPPRDAVRIEEMVNAFSFEYPQPEAGQPFSVNLEIARCPWNAQHRLARIGLQGRSIDTTHRPPGNVVFLIDVSGSMGEPDKLPLLKTGMRMLTGSLVEGDRVSIVTYSDTARVALDAAPGENKSVILAALDQLQAGGSTNGAGGIELAYGIAEKNYRPEGTNRVVLATDGDFNVGVTAKTALEKTIAEKAKKKIQLTVLGFGRGNLQDDRLMALADRGDGQYHYIDSEREARKVLVEQVAGALVTIAKDVKLQVDFNPAKVASYRLLGYEKRLMPAEHFQDDTKDSGDLGAGHTVTAFYELVPPGAAGSGPDPASDAPRFVTPARPANPEAKESFVVKLKYKPPTGDVSRDLEVPAIDDGRDYAVASPDFKFAAAIASFGLILRDSPYKGGATLEAVLELAEASKGSDSRGERAEFLQLVRKAMSLRQP